MNLPALQGSPKQVQWASRIRTERLRVWLESSPERFGEIEATLATMTDAGWWISYRDKDIHTVNNHVHQGIDLQKIQRDQWRNQEKKQERKERSEARAYLKEELKKEAENKHGNVSSSSLRGSLEEGFMKWESPARDTRTGEVVRDPDLPF